MQGFPLGVELSQRVHSRKLGVGKKDLSLALPKNPKIGHLFGHYV